MSSAGMSLIRWRIVRPAFFPFGHAPSATATPLHTGRRAWSSAQASLLLPGRGLPSSPSSSVRLHASPSATILPSLTPCRHYAKAKKTGGGNSKRAANSKAQNSRVIDDLLDELSDDEDDDADVVVDETILNNSPVAKLIEQVQKGVKKSHKGGKSSSSSSHHLHLDYAEVRALVNVDAYYIELQGQLEALKDHFIHQLNVRSAGSLDQLPVEVEGDTYPLCEVAGISKKDPKRLIVDCSSFPQAAHDVVRAIREAGMNLNPQQEGTRIYVPIPKVTKELRQNLCKGAHAKLIETKDSIRKVLHKYEKQLTETESAVKRPKDHVAVTTDVLMAMAKHFDHEAEHMTSAKQKELMGGK